MNAMDLYGADAPIMELAKQFKTERYDYEEGIILGDTVVKVDEPEHLMTVVNINDGDYYPHGYVVCRSTSRYFQVDKFGKTPARVYETYQIHPSQLVKVFVEQGAGI